MPAACASFTRVIPRWRGVWPTTASCNSRLVIGRAIRVTRCLANSLSTALACCSLPDASAQPWLQQIWPLKAFLLRKSASQTRPFAVSLSSSSICRSTSSPQRAALCIRLAIAAGSQLEECTNPPSRQCSPLCATARAMRSAASASAKKPSGASATRCSVMPGC